MHVIFFRYSHFFLFMLTLKYFVFFFTLSGIWFPTFEHTSVNELCVVLFQPEVLNATYFPIKNDFTIKNYFDRLSADSAMQFKR